jgi:hypothetical protein
MAGNTMAGLAHFGAATTEGAGNTEEFVIPLYTSVPSVVTVPYPPSFSKNKQIVSIPR